MANVLSEEKKQQVLALGRLGWSLRRIQQATGIRRETAGGYLRAAGIAVRSPRGWGRAPAKPANEVITDFGAANPAKEVIASPMRENPLAQIADRALARFLGFHGELMDGHRPTLLFCGPIDRNAFQKTSSTVGTVAGVFSAT